MKKQAIVYKENGYEAVLVEYNNQTGETGIEKGFYSINEANQYVENQSLAYQQSGLYEVMPIDEAIEKGF